MAQSHTTSAAKSSPQRDSLWLPLWILPIAFLLIEYLVISFLYDARVLLELAGPAAGFGHLGTLAPLAVVLLTATLILHGNTLREELRRAFVPRSTYQIFRGCIIQIAIFLGFLAVTHSLFRGSEQAGGNLLPGLLLWTLTGIATFVSAITIILPPTNLLRFFKRIAPVVIIGSLAGSIVWLAGLATENLWRPTSHLTLAIIVELYEWLGVSIAYDVQAITVSINDFWVEIASECSGYEGIGLMLSFLTLYFWFARHTLRFPRVLIVMPLAAALVWFLNAIRIGTLIAVGAWWSPDVAINGFHSKAGWVVFCLLALAIVAVTQRSALFAKAPGGIVGDRFTQPQEGLDDHTTAYLMPQLILIAAAMVSGLFITQFDYLYFLPILAASLALAYYKKQYDFTKVSVSWLSVGTGIGVFVLWLAISPIADEEAVTSWKHELMSLPTWAFLMWLFVRIVGSTLVVPIVEELAFRGYLMRRLVSADFTGVTLSVKAWLPLLISSLIFGLLHQNNYIAGFIAGMVYGIVYIHRNRIGDAILAHAVTNGLVAGYVLWTGSWYLWI